MVRHLVSIKINYKTKTVFCFRAINITCFRAALLHVARVFSTFALARPVVALGVLVRAARVCCHAERERRERREVPRHRVESLRRRRVLRTALVGSSHKELCRFSQPRIDVDVAQLQEYCSDSSNDQRRSSQPGSQSQFFSVNPLASDL